ncbi:MAG: TonB-dependent receptor domain-containing protein [Bacteroidia bacterium]
MKNFFLHISYILAWIILPLQTLGQHNFLTDSFRVYGNCEQCKHRIELALRVKGVRKASWNAENKILQVIYDTSRIKLWELHHLVAKKGHDTDLERADNTIYNKLPECCLYERAPDRAIQKQDTLPEYSSQIIKKTDPGLITGIVLSETSKGHFLPVAGAGVYWAGSGMGIYSDTNGVFSLPPDSLHHKLVVRFTGFRSDTLNIKDSKTLRIILRDEATRSLKEVVISERQASSYLSTLSPLQTEIITSKEFLKAACCNLSESFETNPSVDVNYSDAITGAKQIQVLGLSGIYTQLLNENLPGTRGLAASYGLTFIPGPWIESIQVTKGIGSVVNGYESIAGQINVELKKPENGEHLLFNSFVNQMGRTEFNINTAFKLTSGWSSELLLHSDFLQMKTDMNKDGFMDAPQGYQLNGINRWRYDNHKGITAQLGMKALLDDRTGGQLTYDPSRSKDTLNGYGVGINTKRYEAFGKLGYVFPGEKYKSIGFMCSVISNDQNSFFGLNSYNASERSLYANLIYQGILNNTNHKFRAGASFMYGDFRESLNLVDYQHLETVPGLFVEYTYTGREKFTLVAGMREDYNSLYGFIFTPRLHMRYALRPNTIVRIAAGRGERSANVLAENTSLLTSDRQIMINRSANLPGYGLTPEIAWNEGVSFQQNIRIAGRPGSVIADFYRTDFQNQVVADLYQSPQLAVISDLKGVSFSNSMQIELNQEVLKGLDLRLAYRWLDVEATYHGMLMEKPLLAQNRILLNLAYESKSHWKIDYTLQGYGRKRLPWTGSNPEAYRVTDYSPAFSIMNVQFSRTIKILELYAGVENMLDFRQINLIVDPLHPYGKYFDASMVWGPVFGRMVYAGLRLKLK